MSGLRWGSQKVLTFFLLFAIFANILPSSAPQLLPSGKIVDESYGARQSSAVPTAEAAAKSKTIVFFVGSVVTTTAIASAATTTFQFTISLPDMVPTTQPIRSAYIAYNTWLSNSAGPTANTFTLNKQGGSVQTLTGPNLSRTANNQNLLAIRLNATAAMRTLIGNTSGTYAMTFTANLTGPTRVNGENAELYITYDYDPLATTQVNTVYQSVFSTSTQLGTTTFTSASFNFNLPENSPTTTFSVGASSTNHFWIEYRGFIPGGTSVTTTIGWNSEASSSAFISQTTSEFSFILLKNPSTAGVSPNSGNTFRMVASSSLAISAPSAVAIATYSFNFSASTKLRKTIRLLLMQATSTVSTATINTTTTLNIPETSPSSTNAFLFGRLAFGTSTNPGIGASFSTSTACSFPAPTTITQGAASTRAAGYLNMIWDITPSSTVNASGNWTICSSFTRGANVANIPGLAVFLSYDYSNSFAAGSRFAVSHSFLGASNMTTGTTFAASGINASLADASTTASYSWLDAEWDNSTAVATAQTSTIGIGAATTSYNFPARSTAQRQGSTFSATSSVGYTTNATITTQCATACITDAAYNVFGYADVVAANITQAHYHWRNNDGSETGATAKAVEDASTTVSTGTIIRLRIGINNAGDATSSVALRLEYQRNATSGAWTQIATSTLGSAEWQMATSSQVGDGSSTTNIATSTGGTTDTNIFFFPSEVVASTSRNQAATITISGTQFTDVEFAIKASANATTNSPYYFRFTNASTVLNTYSVYPTIVVIPPSPTVTNVVLNGAGAITLTPNTTQLVSVVASTTDPGGPGNIIYATGTIYRTSLGSSCGSNNANCYQLSSSSCTFTNSTSTVICSANLWYFTQSTGNPSSSFPSDSWTGAITVTNSGGISQIGTSSVVNVNVLSAINVGTTSISYGTLNAGVSSGATNQTTTIQNAGNSSTSIQLSGTALVKGANSISTSSQHYATSSFTYGGSEQALSDVTTTISGMTLNTNASATLPAFLQMNSANDATGASSHTVAFGSNVTAGNLIIAAVLTTATAGCARATSSVTDTIGNTFNLAQRLSWQAGGTGCSNNGSNTLEIWYAQNITGGADSVKFTHSASSFFIGGVQEYSGMATTSVFDVANATNGSSTSLSSGSATTTQRNELLVIFGGTMLTNATYTPYMDYALRWQTQGGNQSGFLGDDTVFSGQNYTATATSTPSTSWGMAIAGFMASTVAASGSQKDVFWGLNVPGGNTTGTYTGTTTFTSLFSP